jgi:heme oxygenase
MSVTQIDPTAVLSVAMRDGSRTEHEAAESSRFMEELLGGRINAAGYATYLRRLRPAYEAIETLARELREDPIVAAVYDPALERLSAIDADLEHWAPGEPTQTDSPAALAYAERVRASGSWGGLLVAHHYTRYLGDLSGGQAIGRILDRAFDLGGKGIAFYDFSDIPKPKPYKDAYRARLDALALSADDVERVVAEVKAAFNLNQALFRELGDEIESYRR